MYGLLYDYIKCFFLHVKPKYMKLKFPFACLLHRQSLELAPYRILILMIHIEQDKVYIGSRDVLFKENFE